MATNQYVEDFSVSRNDDGTLTITPEVTNDANTFAIVDLSYQVRVTSGFGYIKEDGTMQVTMSANSSNQFFDFTTTETYDQGTELEICLNIV